MLRIILFISLTCLITYAHASDSVDHDSFVNRPEVKIFIEQMVKKHKFNARYLYKLFGEVKIRPKIIQNFKYPLEQKPWYTYRRLFLTEKRIENGVKFWIKYHEALAKAEKIYGVPSSIIVATIGIESKYGESIGEYRVVDALVNLAFNHAARATFFRKELEEFLLLTHEQHLDPLKVMGSYAGAIGQPQFMPSSYRRYAINFSGYKKIDLTYHDVDVIGSIANYYHQMGWLMNAPVTYPASMDGGKFQFSIIKPKRISLFELMENGLVFTHPYSPDQKFKLIKLSGAANEYWFVFHNFEVIKRYNYSDLYAMAIFQLSYYLALAWENQQHV